MNSVARRRLLGLLAAAVLAGACGGAPGSPRPSTDPGSAGPGVIVGRAVAGPVCPVVTNPPDPACADRPVPGAVVVVADADGRELIRTSTDADGTFRVEVPAGSYGVTGEPVEGLMGAPATPVLVTVAAGESSAEVLLAYDTGIR